MTIAEEEDEEDEDGHDRQLLPVPDEDNADALSSFQVSMLTWFKTFVGTGDSHLPQCCELLVYTVL